MGALTLGQAAQMMREAVKDKSYRVTPLGLEVAHFMRWFRNEYGATVETLRDYEAILAKLAIDHADLGCRTSNRRLEQCASESSLTRGGVNPRRVHGRRCAPY